MMNSIAAHTDEVVTPLRADQREQVAPAVRAWGRPRIAPSILETTANTPIVDLQIPALTGRGRVRVLLKLEFFNPHSSVKDRVGRALVEEAEASGELTRNTYIVEATSGNTGISLAFAAAARG